MPCDEMKSAGSVLRLLLASALLAISPVAALAGNPTHHSGFAGIYVTRLPKTAPSMSVSLGADGTATVTEGPDQGAITSFGHWEDDGHQIKVTFNAEPGTSPQAPMFFRPEHNKLQAVSWNHEVWGNTQPPAMSKGYKVKYLFWSTTMR